MEDQNGRTVFILLEIAALLTRPSSPENMRLFDKDNPTLKTAGSSGEYWTELGPAYASNFLPPSYASGVGRIETMWATEGGDTIYLGSRSGGFWKSIDAGANWHSTTQDLPAIGVWDMAVHPQNENEIFILTRHGTGYTLGLMKSLDYGETWDTTSLSFEVLDKEQLERIIIPESTPDTLYISSNKGFYVSHDGGTTWTKSLTTNVRDFAVKPGVPGQIYLVLNADDDEVLISTDGGLTFPSSTNIVGNASASPRLATSEGSPNVVYFQSTNGVWRSTNSGGSFSFRGTVPANMTFGVSATNSDILVSGGLDIFLSTDGGTNFNQICDWFDPSAPNYVHADGREVRTAGSTLYLATDGYLAKSTDDGTTWNILNPVGTPLKEFYRIGISPMNAELLIGGSQDNGTSAKIGDTWYEWLGADGMTCHGDRNNADYWFGTYQNGSMRHSDRSGQNNMGIKPDDASGAWITPFELDHCNDNTIFAGFDTLYKSNDNGDNWQVLADFSAEGNLNRMALSPSDSNYIYLSKSDDLWGSSDNGVTFTDISAGLPNNTITSIAVHPNSPQTLVVCQSGWDDGDKVFKSTDMGASWTNISGTLPNIPSQTIVFEDCPEERMYLGMEAGVYYLDNTIADWVLYADSLPVIEVSDLKINLGANSLFAGTWGRGAWCAPLVGKSEHPKVTRIDISPLPTLFSPNDRDSVNVTAVFTDDGSISDAWLHWGLSPGALSNMIQFAPESGDTFSLVSQIAPQSIGTQVYFKIMVVDDTGDTTWTEKIVYKTREAALCSAAGSGGTGSDYVSEVTLSPGGFTHSSGLDYYSDNRTLYYPEVFQGSTYTLDVELNFVFAPDSVFAWIDWNNNWVFETEELIEFPIPDPSFVASATFTVPMDANLDTVVMRVRNIYASPAISDPCNSYFGDVEDYSLVVKFDPLTSIVEEGFELKVYPVPADDHLIVEYSSQVPVEMELRNVLGQVVPAPRKVNTDSQVIFNVSSLATGVYFLNIKDAQKERSVKITVSR